MPEKNGVAEKKKRLLGAYPNTYVGSEVCARCHSYAYHVWERTKHAIPFKKEEGGCLDCHSTGYGFGIDPKEAEDVIISSNVGCEACHGPGKQHSVHPNSTSYRPLDTTVCDSCHTRSQSPDFSYSTYWQKIDH